MMEKIILASASPRRKDLLEMLGISFTIHPSTLDEEIDPNYLPSQVVEQLALMKAKDISYHYQEGIVIGADTIVVLDNQILGKPRDEAEAFQMLKKIQGKEHQVFSGVAVIDTKTGKTLASHEMTKVVMAPLTDTDIDAYIGTKEPLDKAGAYGIQGIGAIFIEKMVGDYFNVVGLPLFLLHSMLKTLGIDVIK